MFHGKLFAFVVGVVVVVVVVSVGWMVEERTLISTLFFTQKLIPYSSLPFSL